MHGWQSSVLALAAALLSLPGCRAHWRLVKPVPRSAGVYENDPLPPSANTQEQWVCRNAQPNPAVERPVITAGSTTGIIYGTGAIGHAGDCAVYISYDTARPRRTMRWVKIANLPDCRSQINEEVPIVIPSQLPAGDAVLRWDQYALHQLYSGFIEWFIQCADITISSSSSRSWDSFNSFSMIDNNGVPAYPSSISSYRGGYIEPSDPAFFMTGPACVDNSVNQCALTAAGTKGYTGFGGEAGAASSPVATTSAPAPSPIAGTTPGPSQTGTTETPSPQGEDSGDAMCCFDTGCSAYGTSFCSAAGTWCSGSAEACKSCGGTLCVESAGSGPVPSETTGTAPAPPSPAEYSPVPAPAAPSAGWRPWDGATVGFSAGLCGTPGCGGSYTKTYNVQACTNIGYRLEGGEVVEPAQLPWPFGQGPQPALNECSNPGELREDLCPNILKFADIWQPEVDGRTFSGTGDSKLIQGFGHAFSKVADGLPCGFCAAARAKRVLTDGGYNYMIIMRVDVTDDISPEVDEVTAEFGNGVVQYPEASRIPYEYKLVSCETGQDISSFDRTTSSPGPAPAPVAPSSTPPLASTPAPQQMPAPVPGPAPVPAPAPAPSGSCISNGPESYTAACAALEATCEQYSFCKRATAGGNTPAAAPPTGTCVSNDANIDYSAACQALEATCEQHSFCKRAPALAQSLAPRPAPRVVRQRKFLHRQGASGNILLQTDAIFETGLQPDQVSSLEDEEL